MLFFGSIDGTSDTRSTPAYTNAAAATAHVAAQNAKARALGLTTQYQVGQAEDLPTINKGKEEPKSEYAG